MTKQRVHASSPKYLPALRWHTLTPAYDFVVRVTSGERRFKERLIRHAQLCNGDMVLDVGAGTGTLLLNAREAAKALQLIGIDRDHRMLDRATSKRHGESLRLCAGDAANLPFADGTIDACLSTLFFHHLDDDTKTTALKEIARVLRPGGLLAIADWGAPRSPLSRIGAFIVGQFDGETTHENFAGGLPNRIARSGFANVRLVERVGVPLGVIDILTGTTPLEDELHR